MPHLLSLEDARFKRDSLVSIGVFDGVHLGHQSLLGQLVQKANQTGRLSVVVTFFPHPDKVISEAKGRYYLTTPEKRAELILGLGVDIVITLAFDADFRRLPAADFVARLVANLRLTELWVGADFALGFQREGDVRFLKAEGARHGFQVEAIKLISSINSDRLIRSSSVRDLVRGGAVQDAKSMLGRPYSLAGKVVEGDQRGRAIGIPTANIAVWPEQIVPANGVYATWAMLGGDAVMAATNIGYRPTFSGDAITVEAHLLDFNRDIYGELLELRFVERLRAEKKFAGLDDLVAQIHQDISASRQVLRADSPG